LAGFALTLFADAWLLAAPLRLIVVFMTTPSGNPKSILVQGYAARAHTVFAKGASFLDLERIPSFTFTLIGRQEVTAITHASKEFSTQAIMPEARSSHWHQVIASSYFPLDLEFREPAKFSGELKIWDLGNVSLSRLSSEALRYKRAPQHFLTKRDEQFLVTIPAKSEIFFSQCGKDVRCNPGGFIIERSHEPYEFSHAEAADLWVLKIDAKSLGHHIRSPDRFCSMEFDASNGAGGLFTDMLHLIPRRFPAMNEDSRVAVGRQLVDLLALSLKADERTLTSGASTVRAAHLTRIESFVRKHLGRFDLDPEMVARGCDISTRYLHELLRDTNQTLGQWIREQRLEACRETLKDPSNRQTVAEIAYRWGFGDHAQFSRAFKAQFGMSPKEFRDRTANAIPSQSSQQRSG
jgi:AraC-like DNA-binding protein